jgi:Domain of unknown function (DUF2017)
VFLPRQIERDGDGVRLNFDARELLLLRELLDELAVLLADPDDPALRRLFPPAYSDRESDEHYRSLVRGQLVAGRQEAMRAMRASLGQEQLSAEQADSWLRVLNDLRLMLGTRLDVSEETDFEAVDLNDAGGRELAVYGYLSWLQEQLVEALQPASGR